MLYATSPIYVFEDQFGEPLSMMVWQVDETSFILRLYGENIDEKDGLILLEDATALEALALAETIVQHEGWKLIRYREIKPENGGRDYWEIG